MKPGRGRQGQWWGRYRFGRRRAAGWFEALPVSGPESESLSVSVRRWPQSRHTPAGHSSTGDSDCDPDPDSEPADSPRPTKKTFAAHSPRERSVWYPSRHPVAKGAGVPLWGHC